MALQSGFFDSTSATVVGGFYRGNKAKDAAFLAAWLKNIVRSGYNPSIENCFKIVPSSGLTVSRSAGTALSAFFGVFISSKMVNYRLSKNLSEALNPKANRFWKALLMRR